MNMILIMIKNNNNIQVMCYLMMIHTSKKKPKPNEYDIMTTYNSIKKKNQINNNVGYVLSQDDSYLQQKKKPNK